ncbi:MAG: hypothetical protein R2708_01590 [Vicinamibacterales bacterium]
MVSRHIGGWILVAASLAGAGRDAAGQTMMFPFLGVTNGDLGPIPDGPGPGCGTPGTPRDIRFRPFADAGVSRVDIALTLRHPAAGQLSATLIAPDGTSYEVFPRRGVGGPGDCGDVTALDGRYEFRVDVAYVSRPAMLRLAHRGSGRSQRLRAGRLRRQFLARTRVDPSPG